MFKPEIVISKAQKGAEKRSARVESGELQQALERLKKPLHSEEYKSGPNNELALTYSGFKGSIQYADIQPEDADSIYYVLDQIKKELPKGSPAFEDENWKRLTQFLIHTSEGQTRDIIESVPTEFPIYFCPAETSSNPRGFVVAPNFTSIFYIGDPATLAGVSVLAHEIGHVHNEYIGVRHEKFRTTFHPDAEFVLEVIKERHANAFAFKVLRPYITNLQDRKDVSVLLRDYGQGSYDTLLTNRQRARNAAFYEELRIIQEKYEHEEGYGDPWTYELDQDEENKEN